MGTPEYTFSEVLAVIKNGGKFRRPGWVEGMYICLNGEGDNTVVGPHLILFTPGSETRDAWRPSHEELFAIDYVEVV